MYISITFLNHGLEAQLLEVQKMMTETIQHGNKLREGLRRFSFYKNTLHHNYHLLYNSISFFHKVLKELVYS